MNVIAILVEMELPVLMESTDMIVNVFLVLPVFTVRLTLTNVLQIHVKMEEFVST
jgi:hypothetical protein